MNDFAVHTKDTAPADAVEMLGNIEKAYGFIPNLSGVFAESPAILKAYMALGEIFNESSFSTTEKQVILLAVSRFNKCNYCVAAHTTLAGMQKVAADVVNAIREDRPIGDSKLEALRVFTTSIIDKRGWASEDDVSVFLAAGYTRAQILEVILGASYKTLSNFTNHLADTPLDSVFESAAWTPA